MGQTICWPALPEVVRLRVARKTHGSPGDQPRARRRARIADDGMAIRPAEEPSAWFPERLGDR